MLILMVLLLFAFCFFFDYKPNAKKDSKKEKAVYLSLFAISFVFMMLYTLDVKLPSVSSFIMAFIDSIFGKQGG